MKATNNEYYTRESPYMPTLIMKPSIFKQNKFPDDGISRDLVGIYLQLRSQRELIQRSERSKSLAPLDEQRMRQKSTIKKSSQAKSNQISSQSQSDISSQRIILQKFAPVEQLHNQSDWHSEQSPILPNSINALQFLNRLQQKNSRNELNISPPLQRNVQNKKSLPQIADLSAADVSTRKVQNKTNFHSEVLDLTSKIRESTQTESIKITSREDKKKTMNQSFERSLSQESELELKNQEVLILKRRRFNSNKRKNAIKFLHFGKKWQEVSAGKNFQDNYEAKKARDYIEKQCQILYGAGKS